MKIKLIDWKKLGLMELSEKYGLLIKEIYEKAVEQKLYEYETEAQRRNWGEEEKEFLIKHKDKLTVKEAANVFHKSYNATLMHIKMLGLYEMIG